MAIRKRQGWNGINDKRSLSRTEGRSGYKYGNAEMLDVIQHDGLFCALEKELMERERKGTPLFS